MGFYGNITNTSKTQFQFDRIYPNRATMDNKMYTDNIYAGRYILIEYDNVPDINAFSRIYFKNYAAYTSNGFELETRLNKSDIEYGDIRYVVEIINNKETYTFYSCTSEKEEGNNSAATWQKVVNSTNNYIVNYNIDITAYGESKGYDSTVWQKVYVDGYEKYVQIAELNSVVPTFDLSADAPTAEPITPHFDVNSTNVYYKLHAQPQWGFRIKEGLNGNITTSSSQVISPSDEKTNYLKVNYDPTTGKETTKDIVYPAAIYYNKAGFDKEVRTHVDVADVIKVEPTGISGNKYNVHNSKTEQAANDIQELTMLLPSLGNTISEIWDIIYGYSEETGIRYRDTRWLDPEQSIDSDYDGGRTLDKRTLAGCINTIHDLIGMIITDIDNASLNEEWYSKNYIYADGKDFYRMHKYPLYTTTTVANLNLPKRDSYNSDQEYNSAYESAIKNIFQDKEYYFIADQSLDNYKVKVLNEKSISALDINDIIGYQNGEYGYEFIPMDELPGRIANVHKLILQMKNLLEVEDSETRDQSTVTGTVNTLNDIIEVFEDLVPGEFLICDKNGHVNSANWTTAQDFTYTNYGKLNPAATEEIFNTKENRWIDLSLDKNNNLITFKHNFNPIEDTTTIANKNDVSSGDENSINNTDDDTLVLYTPIVDATGHIVGKNLETVTLPFGYNSITTIGSTNKTKDLDTQQDSVSNDGSTVTAGTPIGESSVSSDSSKDSVAFNPYNINNKNSIICQDLAFDEAGHVTKNQSHQYTLPYGFKTISANKEDASTDSLTQITSSQNIIADNTQDEFVVKGGNKWIRANVTIEEKEEDKKKTLLIGHNTVSFPQGVAAGTEYGLSANANATSIADNDNQFSIPSLKFDQAGHITEAHTRTVTLPNNFASLKVNGEKTSPNSSVNNIAGNTVDISPNKLVDSFQLEQGNRWITLVGNDTSNTIAFYHNAPLSVTPLPTYQATTLSFGGSFNIPNVQYDAAGHTYGVVNQQFTLPTPNLTPANNKSTASVITGLTLNSATFGFTEQAANVGSLLLTGYEDNVNNNSILAATDSINTAFNKLQRQINKTSTTIASLALTAQEGKYIAGLTIEQDGTFKLIEKDLPVIPDYADTFKDITDRLKALYCI